MTKPIKITCSKEMKERIKLFMNELADWFDNNDCFPTWCTTEEHGCMDCSECICEWEITDEQ